MKYILMMHIPKTGYEVFGAWSQKDVTANMAFVKGINKTLSVSGEFVAAEGLAMPDRAKVVRAGNDGVPVTDGVFPESKEFLAGYLMVDVESAKRAYEIAAIWSAAPGPGGLPLNMPIEVRQVMGGGAGAQSRTKRAASASWDHPLMKRR
ncbi:MAG TPA: YciI family protein [Bryobacteraceae bacterium]|nr:YciI family protein [Bryobacteraceae bacterium]